LYCRTPHLPDACIFGLEGTLFFPPLPGPNYIPEREGLKKAQTYFPSDPPCDPCDLFFPPRVENRVFRPGRV